MSQASWQDSPYRFSRLFRTPSSEVYFIWRGEERLGQVDVHCNETLRIAMLTLVLQAEMEREDIEELLETVEEEILASHLSEFERERLEVRVYRGQEVLAMEGGMEEEEEWSWEEWEEDEEEDEP